MMLAALNPNLTMDDLVKLSKIKCAGIERMGNAMCEGMRSLPTEEMRLEYFHTVLPLFLQFCFT